MKTLRALICLLLIASTGLAQTKMSDPAVVAEINSRIDAYRMVHLQNITSFGQIDTLVMLAETNTREYNLVAERVRRTGALIEVARRNVLQFAQAAFDNGQLTQQDLEQAFNLVKLSASGSICVPTLTNN